MSEQAFFATQTQVKETLGLKKLPLIRNKHYKKDGRKSYLHVLRRFGFEPTQPGPYAFEELKQLEQRGLAGGVVRVGGRARLVETHHLVKKTPTGNVPVPAEDIQNDSMYLVNVPIGTPGQTLSLDFDTGSSDLWVFSTELPAATQTNHNNFNPTKSSTWQALTGATWSITYGDKSSASGNVGTDVVNLGGLQVKNQAVELAQKLSAQFSSGSGDGLLGLAWPSINTVQPKQQLTPVANLIAQGALPANAQLFTSAFYSDRDANAQSFYTFGWVDQSLVTASGTSIVWTPIDNTQGFWQFPSTSAVINGKSIPLSGNTAIADTGTTLALLSDPVVKALYAQIPGAKYDATQQGYLIPTTVTAQQLPTFSVAVGDNQFVIQPEDLVFALADSTHWYGAIQSRGSNPFDILGDAFLKSVYAIWDQGNVRFGLVPKIQSTQNLQPAPGDTDASNVAGSTVVRD